MRTQQARSLDRRTRVARGKTAIVLSVGALLENEDLIELAKENGGQIVVPTGALIGLDAVTAAAAGTIIRCGW